jgi:predicted hotdog family 3-hydroxylacyl-ACP dehydratase
MNATATPIPEISKLLPHQAPMILIDQMVAFGDKHAICEVELRADSMFVEQGRVRAAVGIEYMAQSVGAYAGMVNYLAGDPIRIGYLLGLRQMDVKQAFFGVGDRLRVEVHHIWGDLKMGVFNVLIKEGLRICLEGTITVYAGTLPTDE